MFFSRWHSRDSVHAAFAPGNQRARDSAAGWSSHLGIVPSRPGSSYLGHKNQKSCKQKTLSQWNVAPLRGHFPWDSEKNTSGNSSEKSEIREASTLPMTSLDVCHVTEAWSQTILRRFRCRMPLAVQQPLDLCVSLEPNNNEKPS